MPIEWDAARFDTGIEVIDGQHRRLVTYLNELEVAINRGDRIMVAGVIEELVDYTQSHFAFEEALMKEVGYKFLEMHKKVHELFIRRVSDFTLRFAKGEDIAGEVHVMLVRWLSNHIANEDRDYVDAVKAMMKRKNPAEQEHKKGFFSSLYQKLFG